MKNKTTIKGSKLVIDNETVDYRPDSLCFNIGEKDNPPKYPDEFKLAFDVQVPTKVDYDIFIQIPTKDGQVIFGKLHGINKINDDDGNLKEIELVGRSKYLDEKTVADYF